jgi:hypothetical protein
VDFSKVREERVEKLTIQHFFYLEIYYLGDYFDLADKKNWAEHI